MNNFDFTSIPQLELSVGEHPTPEEGVCFYEAVAFFAGEPHSDRPKCACPVLTAYGISLNDNMPDDLRNRLLIPMIGRVAGTRDESSERARAEFLAMWAVNKILPLALRAEDFEAQAQALERADSLRLANKAVSVAQKAASGGQHAATYFIRAIQSVCKPATSVACVGGLAAEVAVDAADGAAHGVWEIAVEGLRQAALIGRHDGFTADPALHLPAFQELVGA